MKRKLRIFSNYSAIIWAICVLGIIVVIALASNFASHDPEFSQGGREHKYLLPMLSFFFTGVVSFGIAVLTGIGSIFIKGEKPTYKAPLGLSFKIIIIVMGVVFFGLFAFLFALRQGNVASKSGGKYNGQQVFDAINQFRQTNGKELVLIEPALCDNLVQRYLDIKNPDKQYEGHAGFVRWVETEGLSNYELAEVYVKDTQTPQEAIDFWNGSPGHRTAILGNYKLGCAYANEGIAVAILGNPKQ